MLSHNINHTVRSMEKHWNQDLSKIVILTDCTSASLHFYLCFDNFISGCSRLRTYPYEEMGHEFLDDMREAGAEVMKLAECQSLLLDPIQCARKQKQGRPNLSHSFERVRRVNSLREKTRSEMELDLFVQAPLDDITELIAPRHPLPRPQKSSRRVVHYNQSVRSKSVRNIELVPPDEAPDVQSDDDDLDAFAEIFGPKAQFN